MAALAMLILIMPFASAAHLFTSMVAQEPLTTLDIEVSVPAYSRIATLSLEGRTKPFAVVHAFVNDVRVRVYNTKEDGTFKLLNMLLASGNNTLKLEAREGEAVVSKQFTVVYDSTPPKVTLSKEIPQATRENSLTVSGDVDEKVTIRSRVIHRTDRIPPDLVGEFKASKTEANAIELTWDPSAASDFKEYLLERNGARIATTTLTSFRDENLQTNHEYTYGVSAVDTSCNIGTPAEITAKTKTGGANVSRPRAPEVNLSCEVPYATTTAGSPFSVTFALIAGINDIEIVFIDDAGNSEVVKQSVLMDATGPKFLETNLEELSPSYVPDVKVKGKLDEQATVFVYINDETKPSAFEVTEADGTFSIRVQLRTTVRIRRGATRAGVEIGEGWVNKIRLEAVDLAGNKAAHGPVDIDFLLCGQGTWWQPNIGEALPSILLPRLMIQGVQQIGIPFNISYVGGRTVKSAPIVDVRPIPLAAEAKEDYDHDWVQVTDYAGKKSPTSYVGYVQIQFQDVDPLPDRPEAGPNERERALSDHRKGECLVPGVGCVKLFLQMEIKFQEFTQLQPTDPRMPLPPVQGETRVQRVCMPIEVAIDQTIPTDIVPKGLLRSALKIIDKAIKYIDKVLEPLTTIGEYVLYGCLVSNVWLMFDFFTEKLACEGSALARGWSKAVAEAGLCEAAYSASGDAQKKQNCLACQKKLESRKKFEATVMHSLCDRIGCPNAYTFSSYIKIKSGKAQALSSEVMEAVKKNDPTFFTKWSVGGGTGTQTVGKLYAGNDCAFTHKDMNFITPTYAGEGTYSITQTRESAGQMRTATIVVPGLLGIRKLHDIAKGKVEPPQGLKLDDCKKYVRPAHPACCGVKYQQEWSSACGIGTVLGDGLDTFDELKQSTCLAAQQANVQATDLGCNSLWNAVAGFCEPNTGNPNAQPVSLGAKWIPKEGSGSRPDADKDAAYLFVIPAGFQAGRASLEAPAIAPLGGGGTAQRYSVKLGYADRTPRFESQNASEQAKKDPLRLSASMTAAMDKDVTECFVQQPAQAAATDEQAQIKCLHKALCIDDLGVPYTIDPCEKMGNIAAAVRKVNEIVATPEKQYIVQPNSGFLRSIECVCIPGVTSYLQMWRSVLGAFHNCFNQILLTGEGSEGFCTAMFSGVVCDLLYEAISCFTQKFNTPGVGVRAEAGDFGAVLGALTGAGADVSRGVNERYGDAPLYQSLFSERKLVHAICTWAFTGTWDLDISGIFQQQVAEVPVETMGALTTCQRTFISYDPTTQPTGLTTWAYRIAGGLIAGADLRYRLKLKCSSGFACDPSDYRDGKCDCSTQERIITVSTPEIGTGIAKKFDLVNFDAPFLVGAQSTPDSDVRYDIAILEWEWTDPQTKTIRTGKTDCSLRETEGGNAPAFCALDAFSGKFRCVFGELEHGIRIIELKNNYPPNQSERFVIGDSLGFALDIKQVFPQERRLHAASKKFLTYDIKDAAGTTIVALLNDGTIRPLRTDNSETYDQYDLETDGTYRFLVPSTGAATPLEKFNLTKQVIQDHRALGPGGLVPQEVWGVTAPQFKPVRLFTIADPLSGRVFDQRRWFLIEFPNYGAEGEEQNFNVYMLNPTLTSRPQRQAANGWLGYQPVRVAGDRQSSQKPMNHVEFNVAAVPGGPPYKATLEFARVFGFTPPPQSLQILVEYSTAVAQPTDPCPEDVSKAPALPWKATFTIYDADRHGNPSDQVSTDPETGEKQQKTVQFFVQCIPKEKAIVAPPAPPPPAPAPVPTPGAAAPAPSPPAPPAAPPSVVEPTMLKAPPDNATIAANTPIKFEWNPIPGTADYLFNLRNETVTTTYYFEFTKETSITYTKPLPSGKYDWYIHALDSNGKLLKVSTIRRFTIV